MIIIVETVRFFLFAFFILSRTNVRASNLLLQRNAKYLLLKRKQKKSVEVQYGALDDVSKKQPEEAEKELSLGATTEPKGSVQKMFSIFEDRAEGRHGALSDDEGRDEDGEESEIEESEIEPEDGDGDEEDEDGSDDEGSELGKDDNEGNDGRRTEEVRNGSSYRETSPNKAYNIIRGRVEKRHESSGADGGDEENEGDENESDLDNDEENESDDDDDDENESDDDDNDGIEDVQRSIHNESNRSFYIEKSDDDDDYIEANEDDEMEEYELMYEMESWVE
jgi:hypothetical protein